LTAAGSFFFFCQNSESEDVTLAPDGIMHDAYLCAKARITHARPTT